MSGWTTGPLTDAPARRAALTDVSHGLLVEAGAGSGKTAILAGRVALLLASGVEPASIAAITFTELAAAELAGRVREYAEELAAGVVPAPLEAAFDDGAPTEAQRRNLAAALARLDELTSTTIHGFARELALPYPVEAGVDPGAAVMDEGEASLLFADVFERWLRHRLGDGAPQDGVDPLALLLTHQEGPNLETLAKLTRLVHAHPEACYAQAVEGGAQAVAGARRAACGAPHDLSAPVRAVVDAGEAFRRLVDGEPLAPLKTREACAAVAEYTDALLAAGGHASNVAMAALTTRPSALFTLDGVRALKAATAWVASVGVGGVSKKEAREQYDLVDAAYGALRGAVAALTGAAVDHLVAQLVGSLREVSARYAEAKRQRAGLDFDDLIANAVRLLREHEAVRSELAERYRYVLVDEFQDTDPLQAEIVWRLTGEPRPGDWRAWPSRPGARFVVGDPNQSIYRFRGADPTTYTLLRDGLRADPGSRLLRLTTNFRSVPDVLTNANLTFAAPLSAEGQAGYAPLDHRRSAGRGPALVRLRVAVASPAPTGEAADALEGSADDAGAEAGTAPEAPPRSRKGADELMPAMRRAEAAAVASLCRDLVTGMSDLVDGPVSPGDIALLAPGYTGLELYERALEDLGLGVASQAGKGFYRRQEVQDMVALTCAIADPANTLALGAFLRGPMVGVTDEELLDVAQALHEATGDARLTLLTDPGSVPARRVAEVLAQLGPICERRDLSTPHALLSEAVAALELRAVLVHRHGGRADRALANLGRFLRQAKAYTLRGMASFADDVWMAWAEGETELEGPVDAEEDAISLITMHSAKGLEWRVVVPVGSMASGSGVSSPWYSRRSNRVVAPVLGHHCSGHDALVEAERAELRAERMRLWYVTATRARDLLVVPAFDFQTADDAWCNLAPWQEEVSWHVTAPSPSTAPAPTPRRRDAAQAPEEFAAQRAAIDAAAVKLERRAPSRRDEEPPPRREEEEEAGPPPFTPELGRWVIASLDAAEAGAEPPPPAMEVGAARGVILHKLLEEVINGSLHAEAAALEERGSQLLAALGLEEGLVDPREVARAALRAWRLPEVRALHGRLAAEVAVTGVERGEEGGKVVWGGFADAIAFDEAGKPLTVIDWKSDRAPLPETIAHYEEQVRAYLRLTGAEEGIIVLATAGKVLRVRRESAAPEHASGHAAREQRETSGLEPA